MGYDDAILRSSVARPLHFQPKARWTILERETCRSVVIGWPGRKKYGASGMRIFPVIGLLVAVSPQSADLAEALRQLPLARPQAPVTVAADSGDLACPACPGPTMPEVPFRNVSPVAPGRVSA